VGAEARMPDPSEQEANLKKYQELLPSLSGSEGKYALIYKAELIGTFDSYADALAAGYKAAGLNPFLVQRIAAAEFVAYFTRDIGSAVCHT
jgi:hypothetical protein